MAKIIRPFPNAKTIDFAGRGLFFVRKKPNKRTKLTSNKKCAVAVHRVIVPVGVKKSVKTQATTAVKFSKYRGRRKVFSSPHSFFLVRLLLVLVLVVTLNRFDRDRLI